MSRASNSLAPATSRLEDRWLLAAAQQVFFGRPTDAPPVATGLDWTFLLHQASLHAMVPCLAHYCEERAAEVPPQVMEQLHRELADVRAYNFFLLQELVRLTALLAAAEVRVLAWKGPALAVLAYPEAGLRQCADLDLLVCPEQKEAAIAVLVRAGYQEQTADTGGHTRNFIRSAPKAVVEVHQMAVQPYFSVPLPIRELMVEAGVISTMAGQIPVPSAEKLLLLLCLHGGKHIWERLIWICDVVLLLRARPNLDWEQIWEAAAECRSERLLRTGLLLADAMAPGVVSSEHLRRARTDLTAMKLASQSLNWLFQTEINHGTVWRRTFYLLAQRERWGDKLTLLQHFLGLAIKPGPADWSTIKLPAWLSFGYYLVRPARLAAKSLQRVISSK